MRFRSILLGAVALAATGSLAVAQVNTVPQVGLITSILKQSTYSATSVGLVPAASATDIFCISAGTSKSVSIKKISIGGTAGTAITTPFLIYQRSALGTSGTAATGLALPVATPLSIGDVASTATLTAYTANPTVAASPILMDAATVDLPVTTAAGGNITQTLVYGESVGMFAHALVIPKNTTKQICVNLNGVSVSSGVLNINMVWTESN